MAKRRKRLNKLTPIKAKKQILLVYLKVRQQKKKEEEKEEPSSFFQRRRVRCLQIHIRDSIFSEVFILYNHACPDHIFKVDMLLDQLTRQFPMRVPPAPAAVEGPRQGFYQPIEFQVPLVLH